MLLSEEKVKKHKRALEGRMRKAHRQRTAALDKRDYDAADKYERQFGRLVAQIRVLKYILEED